jgi:hypothetical protein
LDPSGLASYNKEVTKLQKELIGVLQKQVDQLSYSINKAKKATVNAFLNPVAGVQSATNKSNSTAERVGSTLGASASAATFFTPVGGFLKAGGAGKAIWTEGKAGSSVKNVYQHYSDHGKDFDAVNSTDYVRKAREFFNKPPAGTLNINRSNGDKVLYNENTNTFGIINSYGVPKTFYKPDPAIHGQPTNLDYFYAQQW